MYVIATRTQNWWPDWAKFQLDSGHNPMIAAWLEADKTRHRFCLAPKSVSDICQARLSAKISPGRTWQILAYRNSNYSPAVKLSGAIIDEIIATSSKKTILLHLFQSAGLYSFPIEAARGKFENAVLYVSGLFFRENDTKCTQLQDDGDFDEEVLALTKKVFQENVSCRIHRTHVSSTSRSTCFISKSVAFLRCSGIWVFVLTEE